LPLVHDVSNYREERNVSTTTTRLRTARERRGLSLRELAARTGVPTTVVSEAEWGNHIPRGDHVAVLYRYLGLDLEDVFADWGARTVPRKGVEPPAAHTT
jgi:ribosome-binding protein aMBF1 (putative translation factor)